MAEGGKHSQPPKGYKGQHTAKAVDKRLPDTRNYGGKHEKK